MQESDTSFLMSKIRKDFLKIALVCSLPRIYVDTLSVGEIRELLRGCIPSANLGRNRESLLLYYDELRKQYNLAKENSQLFKLMDEAFRRKRANIQKESELVDILNVIFDVRDL